MDFVRRGGSTTAEGKRVRPLRANPYRQDWEKCREAINAVGRSKLKRYCETKKHPVKNFDRDWEIIKLVITGSEIQVVTKYNMSRQCANSIMRRYWQYAIECKEKDGSD